jgi:glutamine synthetase
MHSNLYNQYSAALFELPQHGKIIAEYVWIDGSGIGVRSKARTLDKKVEKVEDLPEWNYDGSSCYQAVTEQSEMILKPVAMFRDPFRRGDNIIVMCESWAWEDNKCQKLIPANTNFRHFAQKVWDHKSVKDEETWYGIEQEYTLVSQSTKFTKQPLGWPNNGYPGAQGPYYCSIGANVCFGRAIADAHYKACLYAGVTISGTNVEVMPGQLEYQVGPCQGIDIGDHLWISRYLIQRVAEDYEVNVSFAPKLFHDWNGSGCHCNYSTKTMRDGAKGMKYIEDMMVQFDIKHKTHIAVYGDDNQKRLTGIHETSSCDKFSYGVANRAASFRIPTSTATANGKGYIEDRRPASNIDPYVVGALIADTSLLAEESHAGEMINHFSAWQNWRKTAEIEKID